MRENITKLTPKELAELNKGKVIIHVRAQVNNKILPRDLVVETNRYLEVKKKIIDLNQGDTFLLDGAWYDVEYIAYK
jgi:hypothetical protein